MKIIAVDVNDKPIEVIDRKDINSYITRVASLTVFNLKGEMLIAKRSHLKKNDPNKWGPAVAGTVEEGETYESNIIKEALEEIGLLVSSSDLVTGQKLYRETSHKYFNQKFSVTVDKSISDFKIQQDEVDEIRYINISELQSWIKNRPDDFLKGFEVYIPDA